MRQKALRGSGPSFAIITHFLFQTYAAPAQPTYFSYFWNQPLDKTVESVSLFQNLSFSPAVPKEIGFYMVLKKGLNTGDININVFGSYYGSPDQYEAIMQPFLDAMVCR